MPQLRQNPATKEWVIIATERAKRPEDFQTPEEGIGFPISLKGFGEGFDKLP